MMGIEEAAKVLGLSDRQLRRRIEATEPLIAPYLRRGEKNRLLLDQGAVEILRAIEDRRATGRTLADAKAWVAVSVSGKQGSERGQEQREAAASAVPQSGEVAALRELIAELRDERDRLRAEVDRLLPLALPAPRHRSLWPFRRRALPR